MSIDLSQATVTISFLDLQKMQRRVAELEEQVQQLSIAPPAAAHVEGYQIALVHAVEVVRFAVANCDPLTFRGWPTTNLTALAVALKKLYPNNSNMESLASAFGEHAQFASTWERARAEGGEKVKLQQENAGSFLKGGGVLEQVTRRDVEKVTTKANDLTTGT